MDRQEIISELKSVISGYIESQGLDLVDLIYRYEGKDLILRLLVDRPEGGISLGECAELNNQISKILDEEDILQARYILEVSSPGLDRWMKTRNDFLRCINKRVRFFLNEAVGGKIELEGLISKVDDKAVYIESRNGLIEIALTKINKAKQVIC